MQLPDLKALTSVTSVTRDPPAGDPPGADADALADVIDLNYISIDEDASLAQLRGGAARGLVGVWPLAALLNHSCAPNTATVAVEVRRGGRGVCASCRRIQPPHAAATRLSTLFFCTRLARRAARTYTVCEAACLPPNALPAHNPNSPFTQGRLLVRAARPVAKQAELTTSYLAGSQLLAPLAQRQGALREARGFKCG